MSTFHKKWWQFLRQDVSSLFAALIQATRSQEACSHLIAPLAATCCVSVTPNCSSVLCLLKGVSSSTTHFPYAHLMRFAPREAEGKERCSFGPAISIQVLQNLQVISFLGLEIDSYS